MSHLTNSGGQVHLEFDVVTPGHTITTEAMLTHPSAEGGRKVTGQLVVDGVARFDFTFHMRDVAFEMFGLFGEPMTEAKRRALTQRY